MVGIENDLDLENVSHIPLISVCFDSNDILH